MFENPGEKIKKIGKIWFWISVVAYVILAFAFGWTEEYGYYGSYTKFNAEIFFPLLIAGPLVSYISAIFLVAFGDLVENARSIDYRIKVLKEEIQKK